MLVLTAAAAVSAAAVVAMLEKRGPAPPPRVAARSDAPSCKGRGIGADTKCGADANLDCCEQKPIPGGTFKRSFDGVRCTDANHPATVGALALDTFEVTVGRFRAFVAAGKGTRASAPAAGDGAHPKIPGSGWNPAWNAELAENTAALAERLRCNPTTATWTAEPGDGDRRPINCLTFHEAFAFCAWAGGRLPTEAEWNHAAAGGDEQRVYPWSSPPSATALAEHHASVGQPRALPVGAPTRGRSRWGQYDLSGNVWEWTIDTADGTKLLPAEGATLCPSAGYVDPCVDCAQREPTGTRVARGGGYGLPGHAIISSMRRAAPETARFHVFGVRCARDVGGSTTTTQAPPAASATACVPRCAGRACGPDDCGGTCGACPGGAACDDRGQCPAARYPSGPFGCDKGATLPDFALTGFLDPAKDATTMTPFRMSDVYNPTANESYPAGSPLGAGRPKPRALVIHFAAAWSKEAQISAGSVLGGLPTRDAARGGAALS